ncbi:MAG: putative transport system permease protein [Acidimicrobiaceae bacterium]|nr:putative transport system permease protein [Acidimicrobiaceae bacterium]
MNVVENIRIAIRGIGANKLRSGLTVLGLLIGVGAVIILVAVGKGSSTAVQNRIKSLGTNTITVINRGRFGGRSTTGTQSRRVTLTIADVKALSDKSAAPDVLTVSPVVSSSVTATYSGATYSVTVTGTTPSYLDATDYRVQAGRAITDADVTDRSRVVVLGQDAVANLFTAGVNPIGQRIQVGNATFSVIGVLAGKGSNGIQNQDAVAIAPYTAVQDQLTGGSTFTQLVVQGVSASKLAAAQAEISTILASRNDTTTAALPFSILNQGSLLQTSQSNNRTFTVLLGAVAAISLLVGGIGVMNIMLVTVTERTREIGIRKAIGAPKSAILIQFLVEAVLLSLIGGVVGVVVGLLGSQFRIDGVQPVIVPSSILLAFGVAVVVGVFFGLYPANRAASLRPIDALRYE